MVMDRKKGILNELISKFLAAKHLIIRNKSQNRMIEVEEAEVEIKEEKRNREGLMRMAWPDVLNQMDEPEKISCPFIFVVPMKGDQVRFLSLGITWIDF